MHILYVACDELPSNCKECVNLGCQLPLIYYKAGRNEIKQKYLTQRHEKCPLKVVRKETRGLKDFVCGMMRGITIEDDELLLQAMHAKKFMYVDEDMHVWDKAGNFIADCKEVDVGQGIFYD